MDYNRIMAAREVGVNQPRYQGDRTLFLRDMRADLLDELRVHCVKRRRTMHDEISRLIEQELAKTGGKR